MTIVLLLLYQYCNWYHAFHWTQIVSFFFAALTRLQSTTRAEMNRVTWNGEQGVGTTVVPSPCNWYPAYHACGWKMGHHLSTERMAWAENIQVLRIANIVGFEK